MGIRRFILGLDRDELKALTSRVQALEGEVKALKDMLSNLERIDEKVKILEERLKILDHLLEQEKDNRIWLRSLMKELEEVRLELEAIKLGFTPEQSSGISMSEEEEKQLVLALIRKGAHSPSELKRLVPFGVGKLYRILRELERDGLIRNVGKKKKRKYVPAEGEG